MQLRDYQQAAHDALWRDLCTQPGNPVVVMPTGSGKSPLIGAVCQTAIERYGGRVIVLAHRQELLEQNADKIRAFLPALIPVGLHSAGLRRFATDETVICAGIQSVFRKAELFGSRQLVLIDEAHLVPNDGEGMYRTFIDDLRAINPRLRIVGLTATPFRTGMGSLCRADAIFQRVCHETPVKELIDAGWLCPLVSSSGDSSIDSNKLHVRGGEFVPGEAERAFDSKVVAACQEIVAKCAGRKSILVFCQGVEHAEHVQTCLENLTGETVELVVGSTPKLIRANTLDAFKAGRLRWCVNVDVLTTGFDATRIDAIAVLRATMSPGLFAQIVGRGLRLDPGKRDCLVLDFGENVQRHGKLDDPLYGRRVKKDDQAGGPVEKQCPNCQEMVAGGTKECACGWVFPDAPRDLRHNGQAGDEALIGYKTEPEWFEVESISYSKHKPRDPSKQSSMRVDYACRREADDACRCPRCGDGGEQERKLEAGGPHYARMVCRSCGAFIKWLPKPGNMFEVVSEWVCIEHEGSALRKARLWWQARSGEPCPAWIDEAVAFAKEADDWQEPVRIRAHKEGKFWKIDQVEMRQREPSFDFGENETIENEVPF